MDNENTGRPAGSRSPEVGYVPLPTARGRAVEFARASEAAGIDQVWIVEDAFFGGGIATAATALAATRRIVIGVGIVPAAVRTSPTWRWRSPPSRTSTQDGCHFGVGHGMLDWLEQVGASRRRRWACSARPSKRSRRSCAVTRSPGADGTCTSRTSSSSSLPRRRPRCWPASVGPARSEPPRARPAARSSPSPCRRSTWRQRRRRPVRPAPSITASWPTAGSCPGTTWSSTRDRARTLLARTLGPVNRPHLTPLPGGAALADALADAPTTRSRAALLDDSSVDALVVHGTVGDVVDPRTTLAEHGATTVVLIPPPDEELPGRCGRGRLAAAELTRRDPRTL